MIDSERKRDHKHRKSKYQIDIGTIVGRLTVLEYAGPSKKGEKTWKCRCVCGNSKIVIHSTLGKGLVRSCGCLRVDNTRQMRTRHGETGVRNGKNWKSVEYERWCSMKQRCYGSYADSYKTHGARGIKVCDKWLNSFESFLADVGRQPYPEATLERVDNDGNYEPGNVIWASKQVQARNRRTNRLLTIKGQTKTLAEWAEITGIQYATLQRRADAKWSEERLLSPVRGSKGGGNVDD